jgi:hypothetical protein
LKKECQKRRKIDKPKIFFIAANKTTAADTARAVVNIKYEKSISAPNAKAAEISLLKR